MPAREVGIRFELWHNMSGNVIVLTEPSISIFSILHQHDAEVSN